MLTPLTVVGSRVHVSRDMGTQHHRRTERAYPVRVTQAELGKPVASPPGKARRKARRRRCGYGRTEKAKASL